MRKIFVSLMLFSLGAIGIVNAQSKELPFFDEKGTVRLQTLEVDAMADTIATVYHRADDIVWSRVVYKIIDMRDKQNYQLYFPTRPNDEYRSLFRLMLDAVVAGLPVYNRNPREIKPMWDEQLTGADLSQVFAYNEYLEDNLIQIDAVTNEARINDDQYQMYVRNQIKFLIQEIYFFDKHYSRIYSKIMAIAPLYALHPDNLEAQSSMRYFQQSILCWFAFDDLRPFMIKQFVIPKKNDTQRLTFDDFFAQDLFAGYLLGDSNMYNRMLLDYGTIIADTTEFNQYIRQEQSRIQTEMLNFEMDLWDY
ncbi:MAG: gliding motility protein GldN [Prevotellaceae bacterium]|jgi:gliding motility associated protien GldN|nr:gliding motility protein GldN [Prevotellaceae bacterium]